MNFIDRYFERRRRRRMFEIRNSKINKSIIVSDFHINSKGIEVDTIKFIIKNDRWRLELLAQDYEGFPIINRGECVFKGQRSPFINHVWIVDKIKNNIGGIEVFLLPTCTNVAAVNLNNHTFNKPWISLNSEEWSILKTAIEL